MAEPLAVIRKKGTMLEISEDGENPLPRDILQKMETPLIYDRIVPRLGRNQFRDSMGNKHHLTSTKVRLFTYNDSGHFSCTKGYLSRMTEMLETNGRKVIVLDHDSPMADRQRPNCYEPDWDRVINSFTFRPGQDVCLVQIAAHDSGIISAPTAYGKSYSMAMVCVLYPHAKIDVIVKPKKVSSDLHRLITKYVAGVGRVGGGHRHVGRVTIYTADSLKHSSFNSDIVICDEVHLLATEHYMTLLARYELARCFGYSASWKSRPDGDWRRLESLFGPVIYEMSYQEAEQQQLVAPMLVQWIDVPACDNYDDTLTDLTEQKRMWIWRNEFRNKKIAEAARQMIAAGYQVLILADTVDHCLHIRRELPDFHMYFAERNLLEDRRLRYYLNNGLISADEPPMSAARREETMRKFESREIMGLIATSGTSGTGLSVVNLEVLIRADGGSSDTQNIQLPGRASRIDPATGKCVGILIDCFDSFDVKFRNRAVTRRRSYSTRGWQNYLPDGKLWVPR